MNSLAESVIEMTDKEIEAEYDPEPPARTKEILRSAAKTYAQGKLHAAKSKHEHVTGQLGFHSFEMPATGSARRELLNAVLASQSQQTSVS